MSSPAALEIYTLRVNRPHPNPPQINEEEYAY
jgi:hypothetical protein